MGFFDRFIPGPGPAWPYTNWQQLNLDWIIKEMIEFIKQYNHLEQMIHDGEISLDEKTAQGLAALGTKKDECLALLNQWYNSHSADIQNQLTAAITSFNTQAAQIASDVIGSIPQDYSALNKYAGNTRDNTIDIDRSMIENMGYIQHYPRWFQYGVSGDTGALNTDVSQCHSDFMFIGQSAVKFNPKAGYKLHARYYSNRTYDSFVSSANNVSGLYRNTPGNYMILVCTKDDYSSPIDLTQAGGNVQTYQKNIYTGFIMSNEVAGTDYIGNVNIDTVNKIIEFGKNDGFCRLCYSGKIINLIGKTLDYSSFNSNYAYILFNLSTEEFELAGATAIEKPTTYYVMIGTMWGNQNTIFNLNVFPCYYVNGIRTTPMDDSYILSDVHTRNNDSILRIGILGDSLSTYSGVSESALNNVSVRGSYYPASDVQNVSDMWYNQLRTMLRTGSDYIVSAISRCSFRDQSEPLQPPVWDDYRIARLKAFSGMKYLFLLCGVNEQWCSMEQIGSPSYKYDVTALSNEDNTTARGIELTIRKVQTEMPNTEIIVIIPPFTWGDGVTVYRPYTTFRNQIRQIASTYGVKKIIDLAECITPGNRGTYTIDGIHPNKAGMKRIAHFIANKMMSDNKAVDW